MSGDRVLVTRDGATVVDTTGAFDPAEGRLYLPFGVDVQPGDTISIRGLTRTTSADRQDWSSPWTGRQSGAVVQLDPAPLSLPDLGSVFRNTSTAPVLDEDTGVLTFPADAPIWTGPCSAEAAQRPGLVVDLGGQRVGSVLFLLTVPLSLVDVHPGDQFRISQSRDSRLTTRLLTITGVRASTSSLVRELVAFDNEGGG